MTDNPRQKQSWIRSIYNSFNTPFKWIKANKPLAQTYTNLVATLVTLAALLFTIYFSNRAISESHDSNVNASKQLTLSQTQYELSKSEFERSKLKESNDSLQQALKDREGKLQKHLDSIRIAKSDSFQVSSFRQQQEINKHQLIAISKQANTAEAQFNLQSLQSADLYERNKAIFSPDTVTIQKSNDIMYTVSFRIVNTGNTWAHVDSTYLAVYNPEYFYFNQTRSLSATDLAQFGSYKTVGVDLLRNYVGLNSSFYCLIVYYYDTADKKEKSVPKFFRYTYNAKKEFLLIPLQAYVINTFYNEINSHMSIKK